MSRAVMAVMAGLLCALAGVKHAASLNGDAARLTRWEQVLRRLSLLLREGTMSIPEALCAAADSPHPPARLLRDVAAQVAALPMTTLADAFAQVADDCPEKDTLIRLFTHLGHGSKECRVLAVEQAAEEIRLLAQSAAAKADKDAKLWQTLGFTGGICLTILLL